MESMLTNVLDFQSLSLDDLYEYQQIMEDSLPVPAIIVGIVIVVFGLLLCLLGLKMIRFWSAWMGFWAGLIVGLVPGVLMQLSAGQMFIIAVICGVVLGALSFFLKRFGMLLVCLVAGATIGSQLLSISIPVGLIVGAVLALVGAILGVVFQHPIVIIMTALQGGLLAGAALVNLLGNDNFVVEIGAGVVLVILGMTIQFMMRSREVGRKQVVKANKIKDKVSMESEVEAARNILDDDEEED